MADQINAGKDGNIDADKVVGSVAAIASVAAVALFATVPVVSAVVGLGGAIVAAAGLLHKLNREKEKRSVAE